MLLLTYCFRPVEATSEANFFLLLIIDFSVVIIKWNDAIWMTGLRLSMIGGSGGTLAILSTFPRARCADAAILAERLVNVLMTGVFHTSLKSMLDAFFASCAAFLNSCLSVVPGCDRVHYSIELVATKPTIERSINHARSQSDSTEIPRFEFQKERWITVLIAVGYHVHFQHSVIGRLEI